MRSNKIRDALLEASIALSWATHNHLTSGDAEKYLKIVDDALSAPLRNCDRPECATTKAAQEVWRKEDGGKTAYYEWLLETSTKGETK